MKSLDFQETYLRNILGLIDFMDGPLLGVEDVALDEVALKRATDAASEQLDLVQRFFP